VKQITGKRTRKTKTSKARWNEMQQEKKEKEHIAKWGHPLKIPLKQKFVNNGGSKEKTEKGSKTK
jgi:hypothetical protein